LKVCACVCVCFGGTEPDGMGLEQAMGGQALQAARRAPYRGCSLPRPTPAPPLHLTLPATMLPRVTGSRLFMKNCWKVTLAPAGREGGRAAGDRGNAGAQVSADPQEATAAQPRGRGTDRGREGRAAACAERPTTAGGAAAVGSCICWLLGTHLLAAPSGCWLLGERGHSPTKMPRGTKNMLAMQCSSLQAGR
jgi:hypothetical protein